MIPCYDLRLTKIGDWIKNGIEKAERKGNNQ